MTGQRIDRVLELAVDVWAERRKRIPTGTLNRLVGDATARQEPPAVKGKRPKLFYATQVAVAPPTFVFFAREAGAVHFSYRRYLENRLRDELGFLGTPIRLVFRERATIRGTRERGTRAGSRKTAAPRSVANRPSSPKPAPSPKAAGSTMGSGRGKPTGGRKAR
jgi:hypothetical protein